MANQVAARLSGDDYQHLYAWQFVLELKMPKKQVRRVIVEDAFAGSVDDVTVYHEVGSDRSDSFHQVKYHVDQRSVYSTEAILAAMPGQASLLQKFWRTWKSLRQKSERPVELYLVSNWTWDANDKFKGCIDGRDGSVKETFVTASAGSDIGKVRGRWQAGLEAGDAEFADFIGCLRFRLGYDCALELEQRVAERMELLGLCWDEKALLAVAGIVRGWIKAGKQELALGELEATLGRYDLYLPPETERCVTIYLTTIKAQKFDIDPDHVIDWRERFEAGPGGLGHQLKDPDDWNRSLLPELGALAAQVGEETDCRLIRARGLARLSAWFAFGHAFSEVARYTIEVDQAGRRWRTDAKPSSDFHLVVSSADGAAEGEVVGTKGSTVAIGLSVTGSLDDDVRKYLALGQQEVRALLLVRPNRDLGRECLRNAGDVVALADSLKSAARALVKHWGARRLLLFYFGPLSGACFIGHRLNAIATEVQVMEDQQPGYAPSFVLC